jgi:hydroxyacylglutathione hydrolase
VNRPSIGSFHQPKPPSYFVRMKNVNRGGAAVLGRIPESRQLSIEGVIGLLDDPNVVVLDTRTDRAALMKGHLGRSLYAPAKGSFSDFAGSYLGPDGRVNDASEIFLRSFSHSLCHALRAQL